MKTKMRSGGFTLIELMIAVAIVAILATVAYPAYQDQVRKTRRGNAKADLMELAQFLERNYTAAGAYNVDAGGAAIALPFTVSPHDGGMTFYQISFVAGTLGAQTYTLQAVPQNGQTSDTRCGTLTLTQTGKKDITGGTGSASECW